MTENNKFECKSCGVVKEMDTGWATAKDPAPEVNQMAIMPEPPEVEPVDESAEETEYVDIGLGYALGDCDECGGASWQRLDLGVLKKDEPVEEKKPPSVDEGPVKKDGVTGFHHSVPLGPEDHAAFIPPDIDTPVGNEDGPEQAETPRKPKDIYNCEKCGDQVELELGAKTEIPSCSVCGFDGWLKKSF